MDVMDFFDLSKDFKRVVVKSGQTQGYVKVPKDAFLHDTLVVERPSKGQDYAKEYQLQEQQILKETMQDAYSSDPLNATSLCAIEELTSVGTLPNVQELSEEEFTRVYEIYNFSHNPQKTLPIAACKSKIISMIESNQVTIIQGATGCGKTTQVPQYILDSCYEKNAPCNIIITQPRRIAAITVAKRVASERGWPLGSLVGYQVGLNIKTSEDTRLTYCTTGVLLQKLINLKSMNTFTHVIIDEVHERDQDTDFALLVVRKMLRTNSREVKVILMSATFNVQKFSEYFSFPVHNKLESAPIIDLDKYAGRKSNYMICKYYLCQLGQLENLPEIREDEPGITPRGYEIALKLIKQFDNLEKQGGKSSRGAVLVFLPGIHEIEELYNQLFALSEKEGLNWWVRPLHSTITTDEQESVFHLPPQGYRKIILSTNIAESSITVPDIVYVLDYCLTKQLVCDLNTNFTSLQVAWASKTNCTQRAGRSGRVAEGRVYRLVPQYFYENYLEEDGKPEILRCPLEHVVLQAKLLNMGEPKALLALSMDPPDLSNLEKTILLLKETGALLLTSDGRPSMYDGDITFMGRVMAKLPVDILIAKLILLGHVFSVLDECIIMGAAMSLKSVFSVPFQERLAAYHSKLTWADSSCSDPIALLNAFKVWRHNKLNGYFSRSVGGGEEGWAKRYFIQIRTMREMSALVNDLKLRLQRLGIEETVGHGKVIWNETEKPLVLKIVIAGAFYPNFFVRGVQGGQVDEREAVRQLVGRDPYNTVFLQGMPPNQPGELYVKTIKESLKDCADEMKVSFDASNKVFIQFGRTNFRQQIRVDNRSFVADIPGKVSMAVYRAVKMRQLKLPITINCMQPDLAATRARELGLCPAKDNPWKWEKNKEAPTLLCSSLPTIDTTYITLQVSYVIDPGHFWAQSTDIESYDTLRFIFNLLNPDDKKESTILPLEDPPQLGKIYVAPYMENQIVNYYRARVDAIHPRKNGEVMIQVFFIDYGNTEQIKPGDLRNFGEELLAEGIDTIPPQAFECVLSEIQPSLLKDPRGLWTDESIQEFRKIVFNKHFYGKVYSVVHGVISLELIKQTSASSSVPSSLSVHSLNQFFIRKGYAQEAEESYLSRMNHELREQESDMDVSQKQVYEQQQLAESDWSLQPDPDPPTRAECRIKQTLRGPHSPLEMKVYNLTRVGVRREVVVEWNSVNSVLLDTEPQDPHERLLVAACVGQNPTGDRLTLRHTTLMPNIHGLAALISLIFAPSIELRVNEAMSSYTGALCGLGADPVKGTPIFPDHDMEVTFDTEITLNDIQDINRLRYWMTVTLYTSKDDETPEAGPADIMKCQNKVKEFLFKLLNVKRQSLELVIALRPFMWNQVDTSLLMSPGDIPENERAIFRLHWAVQLMQVPKESYFALRGHVKLLHAIASSKEPMEDDMRCKLCKVALSNIQSLRVHIHTTQHRERETQLAENM